MKNTGFADRAFTMGIFGAWIDILKKEELSDSGHAALGCLEDDIKHIAENYPDIKQYKMYVQATKQLVSCFDEELLTEMSHTKAAFDKYQAAYKELKGI